MSDTKIEPQITLALSRQEFKTIGLALAGRLDGTLAVAQARMLNVLLCEQLAKKLTEERDHASGALKHAKEALEESEKALAVLRDEDVPVVTMKPIPVLR